MATRFSTSQNLGQGFGSIACMWPTDAITGLDPEWGCRGAHPLFRPKFYMHTPLLTWQFYFTVGVIPVDRHSITFECMVCGCKCRAGSRGGRGCVMGVITPPFDLDNRSDRAFLVHL